MSIETIISDHCVIIERILTRAHCDEEAIERVKAQMGCLAKHSYNQGQYDYTVETLPNVLLRAAGDF